MQSDLEVWSARAEALKADIHTCIPCTVDAFHASRGTVDLRPVCKANAPGPVGGSFVDSVPYELPQILDVPVVWPMASGTMTMSWPLAAGDMCLLVCTTEDTSLWWDTGSPSDPAQPGRHGLHGYAIPGGVPKSKVPPGAAQAGLTVVAPTIRLASVSAPTDAAALASKVLSELNAIKSAFSGHTHDLILNNTLFSNSICAAGGPLTWVPATTATTTTAPNYSPNSVASATVKID
jgi:hypothetical protein